MKNKTPIEFTLGWYIGEYIYHTKLPTLDIDSLHSSNIIETTEEYRNEEKRLIDDWFQSTHNGTSKNLRTEKWYKLREFRIKVQNEFLPKKLECFVPYFSEDDIDVEKLKEGIRLMLWDTDLCHYEIKSNDDIIIDNSDKFLKNRLTKIVLRYDHELNVKHLEDEKQRDKKNSESNS